MVASHGPGVRRELQVASEGIRSCQGPITGSESRRHGLADDPSSSSSCPFSQAARTRVGLPHPQERERATSHEQNVRP